ncbi:transcriptional regulator [Hypericibacter adhaerens]|uniref:Transcriptional regulator n=1 Tax=Hypericibacter adhaerens TaxID=2602016 RepID=A0A5J6N4G3_9PROT|nr:Lrp/AsnC family transcriptional regulator [Hypericibacter adhaerens]QEX24719.1 transcriptional regulator [Hypericibacter adhaerens]
MKSNKSPVGEVRLSAVDAQIIRCLNEDARISAAAIAERLDLPESTVRYRLGRLVKTGVIEFTAVPNPLHLGYQIWAILEIHAELARLRDIARELASRPEVYFVSITTGNYDILVGAVFRSNEEMLEFITAYLPRVPGIIRTTTSTVLDVVKRFLTFDVPGETEPPVKAPERRRGRKPAAPKAKAAKPR